MIDTGATRATFQAAYLEALAQQPDIVIGPMIRENVEMLATLDAPRVPILALNFLSGGLAAPDGLYQIGLAPEDEARAAAESAIADGRLNAVALAADDDWGTRVLEAFRASFEDLGGHVIATRAFPRDGSGYGEPIRDLLSISASEARHRALTNVLGRTSRFEARRRQDADVVFIAARPDDARMIVPQLRFYRAEALPVYATAAAYDERIAEGHRDGLRFCDVPLLVAPGAPAASARAARALFPDGGIDGARLFALGYDIYGLAGEIMAGLLSAGHDWNGVAGSFTLQSDGALRRQPACGAIVAGSVVPFESTAIRQ